MKKNLHSAAPLGNNNSEQPDWLQVLTDISHGGHDTPVTLQPTERVYDLHDEHPADDYSLRILNTELPDWLDERLRSQLHDMLRGLDRKMALEVVRDVTTFLNFGIRDYTGLWHVDLMLRSVYNKLEHRAGRAGVSLPMQW